MAARKRDLVRSARCVVSLMVISSVLGCFGMRIPVEQKLIDCTDRNLRFQMSIRQWPPYQFVLGLPLTEKGALNFKGEIVVGNAFTTVARVPICFDDVTPCNWLPGLAGYILTWSRREELDNLLTRGQTYDVEVHFSTPPPQGSSLWLSAASR